MWPWEQDFDTYIAFLDETPGSFLLDLAAVQHAPLPTHSARVQVRLTLQQPGDSGLPGVDELGALGDLEDRIVETLNERFGAIFVGHVISEGLVHLVCYAEPHLVSAPETILDGFDPEGYEVAWFVEQDPEWGMYFEFLFPDALSHQTIKNRRHLQALAEHGDVHATPRMVDHFAYFADDAKANAAAEGLAAAGFEVDPAQRDVDDDRWSLKFRREDVLDEERPDEFCMEIMQILTPHEGDYDGWGAPVMRPTH